MTDELGIPEELRPGLDLFAATWLQAWADAGGSVFLDAEGNAQMGFPVQDPTVERAKPYELPDGTLEHRDITLQDGLYIGRVRTLLNFIESMPKGADAVKAHLREHGISTFFGEIRRRS